MRRRYLLAAAPAVALALALAGCAARLGLVDRVEVAAKVVRVTDGDSTHRLADRRFDEREEARYEGEIHESLTGAVGPDDPLSVPEDLARDLDGRFDGLRFVVRGCDEGGCRDAGVVLADFNEIEVGDVVDLRYGDAGAGLVSVHRRRDERD